MRWRARYYDPIVWSALVSLAPMLKRREPPHPLPADTCYFKDTSEGYVANLGDKAVGGGGKANLQILCLLP